MEVTIRREGNAVIVLVNGKPFCRFEFKSSREARYTFAQVFGLITEELDTAAERTVML